MSGRMAESIQSDLEITVNVLRKDVEKAQQRIVGVIRRLEAAGELIIVKSGNFFKLFQSSCHLDLNNSPYNHNIINFLINKVISYYIIWNNFVNSTVNLKAPIEVNVQIKKWHFCTKVIYHM